MSYEPEYITTIDGVGKIYQLYAPFDIQSQKFEEHGLDFLAPAQIAFMRLASPIRPILPIRGKTITNMVCITSKGKPTILLKDPSFIKNPNLVDMAFRCYRREKYPEYPIELYESVSERAKEDERNFPDSPESRIAIALSEEELIRLIPSDYSARFILEGSTQEYFERFANHKQILLYNLKSDKKSLASFNYMHFGGLSAGSYIGCRVKDLDNNSRVIGVLNSC